MVSYCIRRLEPLQKENSTLFIFEISEECQVFVKLEQ